MGFSFAPPQGFGTATTTTITGWFTVSGESPARDWLAAAYDSNANLTYAIDGCNDTSYFNTVTAYSHANNAWTAEASDSEARYGPAAAYDSGANLTYAIDGYNGSYLSAVSAYAS